MTPESKVVSLETAKRLKDAGFPQDTERAWRDWEPKCYLTKFTHGHEEKFMIAAPDAQEIGKLTPKTLGGNFLFQLRVVGWVIRVGNGEVVQEFINANEAEARAEAWLWLKENNLL